MLNWLQLAAGAALGVIVVFGPAYLLGRHDGRATLAAEISADRVTILKDGKAIDDAVLAGDDPYLCAVLGGCVQPDGAH